MTNLKELVEKSTTNANNHGWKIRWDPMLLGNFQDIKKGYRYLSIGDTLALIHSELSEALEEYENNKKEEFTIELADYVIRLLHLCGDVKIDLNEVLSSIYNIKCFDYSGIEFTSHLKIIRMSDDCNYLTSWDREDLSDPEYHTVDMTLAKMHSTISKALEAYRDNNFNKFGNIICEALMWALYLSKELQIDLLTAINIKTKINEKRPKNHGRENL